MESGKGCRLVDVDGNHYIDYLLAYGAIVLGYADAEVDEAAFAQLRRGSLLSLNHRLHVEFAERLLAWFPAADLAMPLKTGSEATTAALRIARRATGRRKVVRCGYHGWHDWCLPHEPGVPEGLDQQVLEFDVDDPSTLVDAIAGRAHEIAAVIVAPEMVRSGGAAALHRTAEITRAAGAVFVLDEVKTAFRTRGGSIQQLHGLRPDLTTVSKALGNGWPIAAVVGRRDVMEHAEGLHCSATYHGDAAAMAAAIATMTVIETRNVATHLWTQGERLIAGLQAAADRWQLPMRAFGEPLPPMPMLRVECSDPELAATITECFFDEMLAAGVLLHPRHLWFICAAHTEQDIDRTVTCADEAMGVVARRIGARDTAAAEARSAPDSAARLQEGLHGAARNGAS